MLESSPNHPSCPGSWNNYLPQNWSLVPKRLGTSVLPLSSVFDKHSAFMLIVKVSLETCVDMKMMMGNQAVRWMKLDSFLGQLGLVFTNLVLVLWNLGKISFSVSPDSSRRKLTCGLWDVFTSLNAGAFCKHIVAVILQWHLYQLVKRYFDTYKCAKVPVLC